LNKGAEANGGENVRTGVEDVAFYLMLKGLVI
jgi:hypothetical protein